MYFERPRQKMWRGKARIAPPVAADGQRPLWNAGARACPDGVSGAVAGTGGAAAAAGCGPGWASAAGWAGVGRDGGYTTAAWTDRACGRGAAAGAGSGW